MRKRTLDMINNARAEIGKEVDDLRDSLRAAHNLIEKYRKEVENLETMVNNSDSNQFSLGNGQDTDTNGTND